MRTLGSCSSHWGAHSGPLVGFHIDVDWPHPTLHLKLAAGHYWIDFLIPSQTALPTDRGMGYSVDIHEGETLHLGALMPSALNDTFPAYGD
jgi:hypothetical protein